MTQEQTPALKACPCCQSDNLVPPPEHWREGCVYCRDCGLRANSPDAWNHRTPDPAVAGLVDALEAYIAQVDAILLPDDAVTIAARQALATWGAQ